MDWTFRFLSKWYFVKVSVILIRYSIVRSDYSAILEKKWLNYAHIF